MMESRVDSDVAMAIRVDDRGAAFNVVLIRRNNLIAEEQRLRHVIRTLLLPPALKQPPFTQLVLHECSLPCKII
jgi:hypothetical protein